VPGELVEDQRQAERQLLVLTAAVGVQDRLVAQLRGGLLDDRAVVSELLVVRDRFPPFGVQRRPGEAGLSQRRSALRLQGDGNATPVE